jgi:hypothetical protein
MTHAPPEARPSRPRAEYRWTNRKAHAFLDALALHGKVAAAARAVGMTRQSAYRLKHRVPVVAEGWARAQAIGRARRRGELPKVTNVLSQGDTLPRQGDTSGAAK